MCGVFSLPEKYLLFERFKRIVFLLIKNTRRKKKRICFSLGENDKERNKN